MYTYLLDGQVCIKFGVILKMVDNTREFLPRTGNGNFWGTGIEYKLDRPDGSYLFHYNVIGAPLIDLTEKYGMSNLLNALLVVQFKFTNILCHHLSFLKNYGC